MSCVCVIRQTDDLQVNAESEQKEGGVESTK